MVSIITSLYKSDNYLDAYTKNLKAFAGFLTAKGFPFEVIIIANEPTAREKQLQKDFAGQGWFKFMEVGREPLYASWNRGVDLSAGEIVGFWNVDDVRSPQAVVEAAELFKGGAELVYFPFVIKRYLKIFGRYFFIHQREINKQVPEFNEASKKEFLRSMLCGPFFMFAKALYQKSARLTSSLKSPAILTGVFGRQKYPISWLRPSYWRGNSAWTAAGFQRDKTPVW